MLRLKKAISSDTDTHDGEESHDCIPLHRKAAQRDEPGTGRRITFDHAAGSEPEVSKLVTGKLDNALGKSQLQEYLQAHHA